MEARALRMAELATGHREDALDLVQETMLRLASKYAHKDPQEWRPLFYRILQSRIVDWARRKKIRDGLRTWFPGRHKPDDGETEMPDPMQTMADPRNRDPQREIQTQGALETLVAALAQLPLRQQQAFMLRAWEGLDVAQTAFAMGCSQGSVKTHYARATQRLRTALEGVWP